jgi:3-oxoacyl-[acyl-carrier protein] reductase
MDLGLDGKVVLVTAASQGLGKATALSFARERARVAICAREAATIERAAQEIRSATSAECAGYVCDLTDPAQIDALVASVVARFGTVHVLVNNAGGPRPGRFDAVADDDWQRAFELTLLSAVRVTRAVLPHMRRQRWGRVINLSSSSVKQPITDIHLSNSLRMGAAGWAKALANEVAADNVLVNSIGTGWTRTERVTQMVASRAAAGAGTSAEIEAAITRAIPLGRMGRPQEIADVAVFLASERASFVTGAFLTVDGGGVQSPI